MQTQMPGPLAEYQIDPYRLVEDDLKDIFDDIRLVMTSCSDLKSYDLYFPSPFSSFFSIKKS